MRVQTVVVLISSVPLLPGLEFFSIPPAFLWFCSCLKEGSNLVPVMAGSHGPTQKCSLSCT